MTLFSKVARIGRIYGQGVRTRECPTVNDFYAYWWESLIIQLNMSHLYESSDLELIEHLFVVVLGIGLNCQIRVTRTGGG